MLIMMEGKCRFAAGRIKLLTYSSLASPASAREGDGNASGNLQDSNLREQVLVLSCWYICVESARSRAASKMGRSMHKAMGK